MASRIISTAHSRISARMWLSLLSLLLLVVSPLDALSSPQQQQQHQQQQQQQHQQQQRQAHQQQAHRQGQRLTRTRLGFWTTRESHFSTNENDNDNDNYNDNPRRGFLSLPLRSRGGNRVTASDNNSSNNNNSNSIRSARNRFWTRLGMKRTEGNGALPEYEPMEDDEMDDVFFGGSSNDNDNGNDNASNGGARNNKNKLIEIQSEIELPFSAEVAYDAYSDLPRQPSWSSWLESVEVIQSSNDSNNDNNNNDNNNNDSEVRSLWTSKMFGIRYSWTAVAVRNERPHTIQWRSVTGLRNEGIVRFRERKTNNENNNNECNNNNNGETTLMTLRMVFVAPRAVSAILKRSKKLSGYVEEKMIAKSLQGFRDIVLENDVKKKQKQKQPTTTTTTTTTTKTKTKTPQ